MATIGSLTLLQAILGKFGKQKGPAQTLSGPNALQLQVAFLNSVENHEDADGVSQFIVVV